MDKMTLGAHTFWRNPVKCTIPQKDKFSSFVRTYDSVAYFSWGSSIEGREIEMEWPWMTSGEYADLITLVESDTQMVWDPQTGTTYNVELTYLEGAYVQSSLLDAEWRNDVILRLVILSEV